MSDIWRWPALKLKMAIRLPQRTTSSTLSITSDRCSRAPTSARRPFSGRARQPSTISRGSSDFPEPRPRPFRIERKAGGFAIVSNSGIAPETLPLKLHIRCVTQAHRRHLSLPKRYIRRRLSIFAKDRKDRLLVSVLLNQNGNHFLVTLKRSIKRYEYYADTL